MDEYEVVCIDREIYPGGGYRIFQLGVRRAGGGDVSIVTEEQVQRDIRRGVRYFVLGGVAKAYLQISISQRGAAFVETEPDQTKLDNLAALPVCKGDRKAPIIPSSPRNSDDVDAGADGGPDVPGPDTDVDQGTSDDD
jgi:hypothetical protein